jgi:type IV pilus assembly protein PilN
MKLTLNLATRPYLNRRTLYTAYAAVAAVLTLLLALNLGTVLRSRSQSRQLQERLAEIERASAAAQGEEGSFTPEAYEKLLKRIRFANEIIEQESFRWTVLLSRLEEDVPDGVGITGLRPDFSKKTLAVTGLAREVDDLRLLLDNLIASPHYDDVLLLQQGQVEARDGSAGGIAFSLSVRGGF